MLAFQSAAAATVVEVYVLSVWQVTLTVGERQAHCQLATSTAGR